MRTVAIVLNPAAAGGRARRHANSLLAALELRGVAADLHQSTGPGSARELARQLAGRTDLVVAAGGDGTIHEVANGLLEADAGDTTLALYPIGTGNDFVKVVPGTRTPRAALETIVSGQKRLLDVGRARWNGGSEYFVNGMGIGIDVEVVRQLAHVPQLPGAVKYLLALLRALRRFQPLRLRLTADAERIDRTVMIAAVSNGVCQGGGFYLAPKGSPTDGRFDLTVVDKLNLAGIARVLPKVLRGTQQGDPAVDIRPATLVRMESPDQPLFFQLDGELREPPDVLMIDLELLPRRLAVLAGSDT